MHIGEVSVDASLLPGQLLVPQRLDATEAGIGKAITLLGATFSPDRVKRAGAGAVAALLGFDPEASGAAGWDLFHAVATPGDVVALLTWAEPAASETFERRTTLPGGVRLRHIRVIRDYGMFGLREAPQYFTEAQLAPRVNV